MWFHTEPLPVKRLAVDADHTEPFIFQELHHLRQPEGLFQYLLWVEPCAAMQT